MEVMQEQLKYYKGKNKELEDKSELRKKKNMFYDSMIARVVAPTESYTQHLASSEDDHEDVS